jgi:tetratricopeptide (TPR) repeat protein
VWKVAAVAFLVVSVTALAWRQRLGASVGSAAGTARTMVVAPFRVSGADPSLAFLREGMIDLLAVRLADAEGTPVADPGSVISAWREAGRELSTDVPQSAVLRLAARLGASQVVTGNIVGSHSNIVITATLSRVAGNELEARVTVNGPVDSLTALVDRLAVRLLATEAGEDERLARQTTPSMSALRAYLDGQAAYRRSKYQEAARDFERAVRDDSTFALAALYLALAADRVNEAEQHDRALALAWASRDELSDRDEAHLVAFAGPRYPAPSPAAEQLAAWQRAVTLAPDRADVWVELGERLLYDGAALGIPDHIAAATAALHRALALDPELGPARHLLLLAAAHADDPAALRALTAAHPEAADTDDALRWRMAVALGDSARLRDIRSRMATLDRSELRAIGMMSQFDAVAPADAEKALLLYRERAPLAADQLDAILALHSLALNQGRPALALRLTEQLQELQPLSRAHLRLRVLDALYGDGDSAAAASAAQTLASYADARGDASPLARATRLADICVVAQWRLAHGDIGPVPRAIEQLRSQRIPREPVPIAAAPVACGELLDASLAVATGARDAAARVSRLDSLMLTGPAVGDAASYAHILLARLHMRLGHPRLALGALERRTYLTGWPRYRSTALRMEAQLAERVGERERAARAERRYKELRGATGSGLGS